MRNFLLSFIVPFYNVEKHIGECIHSLFNQDIPLEQYEVILINDCSTDSSKDIVCELRKIYPTIILIDLKIKKGVGSARNKGVSVAKGEYIWFVDSDDFIERNIIDKLLKIAKLNDLDVLHFGYYKVNTNGDIQKTPDNCDQEIVDGNTFFFDEKQIWWEKTVEVWKKLIKRSLLVENNLKFVEDTYVHEDLIFSIEVFNFARRVMHNPIPAYYYRINPDSFLHSPTTSSKLLALVSSSLCCIDLLNKDHIDNRYYSIIKELTRYHFSEVKILLQELNKREQSFFFREFKTIDVRKVKGILKCANYMYFTNIYIRSLINFKHKLFYSVIRISN